MIGRSWVPIQTEAQLFTSTSSKECFVVPDLFMLRPQDDYVKGYLITLLAGLITAEQDLTLSYFIPRGQNGMTQSIAVEEVYKL